MFHLPSRAVDPGLKIEQLYHTAWKAADGAPSDILTLAQTADGFLWIGSTGGLFRFDGLRFETIIPTDRALRSPGVTNLLAAPDGSLWIGFVTGVARLKDGHFTFFDEGWQKGVSPVKLFLDRDDRLWATSSDGIFRLDGQRWRHFTTADGFSSGESVNHLFDARGDLVVSTDEDWFFLKRGSETFVKWGHRLAPVAFTDPAGNFWSLEATGLLHASIPADGKPLPSGRCSLPDGADGRLEFDRNGILWMAGWGGGLTRFSRLPADGERVCSLDRFTEKGGLSGDTVESMLEDREGNFWFGTNNGLDRFRNGRVVAAALSSGHEVATLTPRSDGTVLASNFVHGTSILSAQGNALPLGPQGYVTSAKGSRSS